MIDNYILGKYTFNFQLRVIVTDTDKDKVVELSSTESEILKTLFVCQPNICSKEELESAGWPGRPVSSSSLTVAITALRKKLAGIEGIVIRNVPRQGYFLLISESDTSTELPLETEVPLPPDSDDNHSITKQQLERPSESLKTRSTLMETTVSSLNFVFISFVILFFHFLNEKSVDVSCTTLRNKTACSVPGAPSITYETLKMLKEGETVINTVNQLMIINDLGVIREEYHHE